jgi:hypothetical protein
LELLRDHGLRPVSADYWWGKVEEGRIFNPFGGRFHSIPDSYVHLDPDAPGPQVPQKIDALSPVGVLFSDVRHPNRIGVITHAIVFHGMAADLAKNREECCIRQLSEAKKVCIPSGSDRLAQPSQEKEGSFEDKALRIRRHGQAIEEALHPVAGEDQIGIQSLSFRMLD